MVAKRNSRRLEASGYGAMAGGLAGFLFLQLDLSALVSYWGDRAMLVVVAASAGALLWHTRLRWVVGAGVLVLAVLWGVVAFSPLCQWMARDLPRTDPIRPADAVFVFGSKVQRDGDLTTEAMGRLLQGLKLLAQGHAPRLIVSELPPPSPSYAASCRKLMRKLGMDHEVLAVGPITDTHDEAVAVAALFEKRGWTRVLAVTAPLHSRRASAALEHEGVDVVSSPATEHHFDLQNLTEPEERLLALGKILHELLGSWVYALRDWI